MVDPSKCVCPKCGHSFVPPEVITETARGIMQDHLDAEILSAAKRWHREMGLVAMISLSTNQSPKMTTGLQDAMADLVAALKADEKPKAGNGG